MKIHSVCRTLSEPKTGGSAAADRPNRGPPPRQPIISAAAAAAASLPWGDTQPQVSSSSSRRQLDLGS